MSAKNRTPYPRRDFIKFLGRTGLSLSALSGVPSLISCQSSPTKPKGPITFPTDKTRSTLLGSTFQPLLPSAKDELLLAPSLQFRLLTQHQQKINSKGETFGYNCDYTAYIPFSEKDPYRGWLWVNHEAPNSLFINGKTTKEKKTQSEIRQEQLSVGGSILEMYKDPQDQQWKIQWDSRYNKRLTALTPIRYSQGIRIANSRYATGTLGNCAGGVTPWSTFLTCEENYHDFYGEYDYSQPEKPLQDISKLGWTQHFKENPEQYGWVVEVQPQTGQAQKLISLGRFAHEGATVTTTPDGRVVVYMGDDKEGECLYKFISSSPGQLTKGQLYVADLHQGKWLKLDAQSKALSPYFKNQLEVQVQTRRAAKILGGTPLDRPEGIAIDPETKSIIVSLSNNKHIKNHHGSLLRVSEKNSNPLSLEFTSNTLVMGGEESGLTCPDNLAFDAAGNLWVTNDIDDRKLNRSHYKTFKNNGLFVIPMKGPQANQVLQVGSGPVESELTGPFFLPDGSLILSVQHPGNRSKSLNELTSHWPGSGDSVPQPGVVVISAS